MLCFLNIIDIQICNVKPIPKIKPEFENRDIPEKIISYYLVNDVSSFQFDRPVQKGQVDKDNEFKVFFSRLFMKKIYIYAFLRVKKENQCGRYGSGYMNLNYLELYLLHIL